MNILHQKIKPNWILWILFSLPVGTWLFFVPYDRGGSEEISDWGFLSDWVKHYMIDSEFWGDLGSALLVNFGPPIAIGWILQYLVMFAWQNLRRGSNLPG
jgi:hypothetical protein